MNEAAATLLALSRARQDQGMLKRLHKLGGSLAVVIPKSMLRKLAICEHSLVRIEFSGEAIVISKAL